MASALVPAAPAASPDITSSRAGDGRSASALYVTIWRWHFYAGLIAIPFLVTLAITGMIYLFKDEIGALAMRDRLYLAEPATERLPVSDLIARAEGAVPGAALARFDMPPAADRSAEAILKTAEGGKVSVWLDPGDGRVLASLPEEEQLMSVVERIHSLAFFGTWANRAMEAAAGWTIVLTVTGFYLWWPRAGRTGGVVGIRGTAKRRVFWRDLHAVSGAFAGLVILFLAVSGMPWSGLWGDLLTKVANRTGQGYPAEVWDAVPSSTVPTAAAVGATGWTMAQAPMPRSTEPGSGSTAPAPIGVDAAVAAFDRLGIAPGYRLTLPDGPSGVYSAMIFPDELAKQRVIHLDQYSGAPLIDVGVADYGGVAQAVELGVSIHMGQWFGLANQLLMLAGCLAILVMAVAAVVMWWKRRPAGRLGAPRALHDTRLGAGIVVITLALAIVYPLVGATLLMALAIERLLPAPVRARL